MAIVPIRWLHFTFQVKISLDNKPLTPSFVPPAYNPDAKAWMCNSHILWPRWQKPPAMLVKQEEKNREILLTHLAHWGLKIRWSLWTQGSSSHSVPFSHRSDDLQQNPNYSVLHGSPKKKKARTLLISLRHCISSRLLFPDFLYSKQIFKWL